MGAIKEMGMEVKFPGTNQPFHVGANECCNEVQTCQDALTILNSAAVTGATYVRTDGTTIALSWASVTGATAAKAALEAALKGYEANVSIATAVISGTQYSLRHIGQGRITQITVAGTPTATTKLCTTKSICTYCTTVGATPGAVIYNGASSPLSNAPYSSASTLQTDIIAALTALSAPFVVGSVAVAVDAISGGFSVQWKADGGKTFTIGVKVLETKDCTVIFA